MASHDSLSEQDENLVAAAEAAASWARARRTAWTDAPLEAAAIAPPIPARGASVHPTPALAPPPVSDAFPPSGSQPSLAARVATSVRAFGPPVVRWLPLGAVVVAVGVAAFAGVHYWLETAPTAATRPAVVVEPARPRPVVAGRKATGGLRVSSTPTGAKVLVDAKARGVTPLTLTDLTPGRHEIVLQSDAGTVHRTVKVAANETAEMNESIFSGWLVVYAPFEVAIAEGERVLQADGRNQIMLPPGIHQLRLANRALAFEAVREVDVQPGQGTTLRLIPPSSTLTVTASEPAEVWIDGARVGETPLNAAPATLGSHEVVVKRDAGGERRYTVTIGAHPFTLAVDFR